MALPASTADGGLVGLTTGWLGSIHTIQVNPALDVNVLPKPEASFQLDQTTIDASAIMNAGPPGGLFVGIEAGAFAVRTAGTYALSARLERFSEMSANCLVRLGFARHRLISSFAVNMGGLDSRSYAPVAFELQPGLYQMLAAFGCWHEGRVVGDAKMTVLVRHPGEPEPKPLGGDEILRPSRATD